MEELLVSGAIAAAFVVTVVHAMGLTPAVVAGVRWLLGEIRVFAAEAARAAGNGFHADATTRYNEWPRKMRAKAAAERSGS